MLKKILLAIVLLIVVVIIGLGITAKYYAPKMMADFVKNDKTALVQVADQFLFNIRDGKPEESYEMTVKEGITVQALSDPEFKADLKNFTGQNPELYKVEVSKFLGGNYKVKYLTVTNFSDGEKGQLGVTAIKDKENNVWKIVNFYWATLPDKIW